MWEKVKLGDYIKILSGFAFKSSLFTDDEKFTPLIRIRDIKRGYTTTFYKGDYDKSYLTFEGDLLLGMDGQFNIAEWKGIPSLLNQRVCKITPNDKKLNKKYFYFIISKYLKAIEATTSFVTVKHLSIKTINNIEIPLPPLPIQEQIAAILDKADELRRKDQELQDKYDELAQAIFIDMFGDPVRNEKGWETVNFEKVLSLKRGYDLPVQARNSSGNIPVYGSNGVLGYHSEPKLNAPCIVTGRSGSIGFITRTEEKCWPLNTTLYSYKTNGNNLIFLEFLLKNFKIKRFAHGAGVPTLDRKLVHKELLPYISLHLQEEFAKKIELINKLKAKANKEKSEDLFQSLLQRAFKGELVS